MSIMATCFAVSVLLLSFLVISTAAPLDGEGELKTDSSLQHQRGFMRCVERPDGAMDCKTLPGKDAPIKAGTGIVYILGSASAIVANLVPYYKLYANYTVIQERQACFCFNDPTNGETTCEGNCDERGQRFDRQTRSRTRTRTNVRTRRQEEPCTGTARTRTHRQDDDRTSTRHTGASRARNHRQESPRHIDGRTPGRRQESPRHIDGRTRGRRQEQYTQNCVLRRAICQDARPKKRYSKCQVPRRKREEERQETLQPQDCECVPVRRRYKRDMVENVYYCMQTARS